MKAISPVIATVIIVAVAIAISIAVALWITGLTSSFTGVEKLEIVNAYATGNSTSGWNVTITVKNTGTKAATVDNIFINSKPYNDFGANIYVDNTKITSGSTVATLDPGDSKDIIIEIPPDKASSGQTVSIVIHTASGGQYPATVTLP